MKKKLLFIYCFTAFSLFLFSATSQASMKKLTLSYLINEASHICYGQVTDLKSEWDENRAFIYTTVNLSVFESLKGKLAPSLSIKVRGGIVGDITQRNSNSPAFWPNEEVLVFVNPESGAVGDYQGKFHVHEGRVVERGLALKAFLSEIKNVQSGKIKGNFFPRSNAEKGSDAYSVSPYHWCQPNPMGEDFYINEQVSQDQQSACLAAALTWNASRACFQFSYGGTSPTTGTVFDGTNVIYWGGELAQETLAETTYWFNNSNGCMLEVDCEFNDQLAWSTSTTGEPSTYDVQTAMLHEFGHYLSLDHSKDPEAIMYPYYSGIKRSLGEDDIAGIKQMYGDCSGGEKPVTWNSTYPLSVGSPANLSLLREYRDQVLRNQPGGKHQIKYLYSQSKELLQTLVSNPKLILEAQQIIKQNLPEIQKAVNHQQAALQDTDAVYNFLNNLASSNSSLKTKIWLNGLKRELKRCQRSGRKFYGLYVQRRQQINQ